MEYRSRSVDKTRRYRYLIKRRKGDKVQNEGE